MPGFGKSIKKSYMKAKKAAYGSRGVKGRYYRVGAVQGLQNLAKDVAMIKSRLNVEKKFKDHNLVTGHTGQVNVNGNGIYMLDVTPSITQGIDSDERIGNSLKITGLSFPFQFNGSSECISARKIRVMLFRVTAADNGVNATECINDYYDVNPITGIIDMNSPRAYRKGTHDGIKLIRQKTYTLPAVHTTAVGGDDDVDDREYSSFMAKFNVKLQDVVRYNQSSDTAPDGTRYYMFIMSDKGNIGSSGSSLSVPITRVDTGVRFRVAQRTWWVDN